MTDKSRSGSPPRTCSQCGNPKTGPNPFLCEACMLANYGPPKPWIRNWGHHSK